MITLLIRIASRGNLERLQDCWLARFRNSLVLESRTSQAKGTVEDETFKVPVSHSNFFWVRLGQYGMRAKGCQRGGKEREAYERRIMKMGRRRFVKDVVRQNLAQPLGAQLHLGAVLP